MKFRNVLTGTHLILLLQIICLLNTTQAAVIENTTVGDLGVWMPIYDCWYYGGNPDDVEPSQADFDPYKDINFILYNQAYPGGKSISDVDKEFRRRESKLRWMNEQTIRRSDYEMLNKRSRSDINAMKILSEISLDPTLPIKFLIHGFTDNGDGPMIQSIKDAYLDHPSKFNIIAVDWGKGSGTSYSEYLYIANYRVPMVARRLAHFIEFITNTLLIDPEKITLIGHSLGAQISGYIGKMFNESTNMPLPVIVGLDPALPAFKHSSTRYRLNATDAKHVQVIHTASGCLGFDEQIGTVDFYPNYNGIIHKMPGCGADPGWHCSHSRAYEYFAESIDSSIGFKGWKCDSLEQLKDKKCVDYWDYAFMGGEPLDVEAKGVYTLKTGKERPFARPASAADLYSFLLKNGNIGN